MTKEAFERSIEDLLIAIESCFKSRLVMPGLILVYSGIDIMAWLNCPESHLNVQRSDFIDWADKYLLPDTGLACNAIDLYAARCSLLHSYTAESQLSRAYKAKQIFYAWGTGNAEDLQELIDRVGTHSAAALHIERLFDAFRVGIQRFKQALSNDPKQANLAYERAGKFFVNMPH